MLNLTVRPETLLLIDVLVLGLVAVSVPTLVGGGPAGVWGPGVAAGLALGALYTVGAYRIRTEGLRVRLARQIAVAGLVCLTGIVAAAGFPSNDGLFVALAGAGLLLVPVLASSGLAHHALLGGGNIAHRILLLGDDAFSQQLATEIRAQHDVGARLVGWLGDGWDERFQAPLVPVRDAPARRPLRDSANELPALGTLADVEKVLKEFVVHRVVVATNDLDALPADVLIPAKLTGIRVETGWHFLETLHQRIEPAGLRGVGLVDAEGYQPGWFYLLARAAFDRVVAVLGLILASPLVAAAIVAIKLDSPGPAFYLQTRSGLGGRPFRLFKLRTMSAGAESGRGACLATPGDPRVTRVGRFLRRTRIDEIPQLWNVLRGEMALIGPRPERPELIDELVSRCPLFRHRTALLPGITGWAQVRQGYVDAMDAFETKLSYDLFYVKHRSFSLDLRILFYTLSETVRMRGQ
jgi:exopolysaccharide biosynthesis polyprenyl glycosylphosphotransferase